MKYKYITINVTVIIPNMATVIQAYIQQANIHHMFTCVVSITQNSWSKIRNICLKGNPVYQDFLRPWNFHINVEEKPNFTSNLKTTGLDAHPLILLKKSIDALCTSSLTNYPNGSNQASDKEISGTVNDIYCS